MAQLVDWGTREYRDALAAMRELARARRAGEVGDTLVLVEHPPVVTVGVEGDDGGAASAGLPVVAVERGGRATYHGPGQLVGYPIVDLTPRGRDVRAFVHEIEETVVRAVREFGVTAAHVAGRRGVWVAGARKIASVGVAVEGWVTFHGFALNVNVDLAPFARFHPCGFDEPVMTSLERELGQAPPMEAVKAAVVRAFDELEAGAGPLGGRPARQVGASTATPA
jgi:lipoyl(octanoyl) transferase